METLTKPSKISPQVPWKTRKYTIEWLESIPPNHGPQNPSNLGALERTPPKVVPLLLEPSIWEGIQPSTTNLKNTERPPNPGPLAWACKEENHKSSVINIEMKIRHSISWCIEPCARTHSQQCRQK